ncbi:HTH domain-containing protein [uncultured Chryseobacterium sp.]|uniref:HTH domain-containing protein n=1 Tax=uncultured Chryseobacterium sp. TaxID=259322 RepID=UPI0025EDDC45|nr:HTH domain-containing protein [uncultured Chryseobacterium sp.]
MTFLELAEKILIEEKKPLTAIEIWNIATTKGYEKTIKFARKNALGNFRSSNIC